MASSSSNLTTSEQAIADQEKFVQAIKLSEECDNLSSEIASLEKNPFANSPITKLELLIWKLESLNQSLEYKTINQQQFFDQMHKLIGVENILRQDPEYSKAKKILDYKDDRSVAFTTMINLGKVFEKKTKDALENFDSSKNQLGDELANKRGMLSDKQKKFKALIPSTTLSSLKEFLEGINDKLIKYVSNLDATLNNDYKPTSSEKTIIANYNYLKDYEKLSPNEKANFKTADGKPKPTPQELAAQMGKTIKQMENDYTSLAASKKYQDILPTIQIYKDLIRGINQAIKPQGDFDQIKTSIERITKAFNVNTRNPQATAHVKTGAIGAILRKVDSSGKYATGAREVIKSILATIDESPIGKAIKAVNKPINIQDEKQESKANSVSFKGIK